MFFLYPVYFIKFCPQYEIHKCYKSINYEWIKIKYIVLNDDTSKMLIWMLHARLWNCHAIQITKFSKEKMLSFLLLRYECFGKFSGHNLKLFSYDILFGSLKSKASWIYWESVNNYQMKSGWPVEVKQRCHIRLLGSTNRGCDITSGMGK